MFRLLLRPKVEILELKWHFASYGLSNFIIDIQVIELFSLSSFYRAKCSLSHVILQWKRRTPIPQISGNRACQVSFLSLTNTGVDQGFNFGGVGWGGLHDSILDSLLLIFWGFVKDFTILTELISDVEWFILLKSKMFFTTTYILTYFILTLNN